MRRSCTTCNFTAKPKPDGSGVWKLHGITYIEDFAVVTMGTAGGRKNKGSGQPLRADQSLRFDYGIRDQFVKSRLRVGLIQPSPTAKTTPSTIPPSLPVPGG